MVTHPPWIDPAYVCEGLAKPDRPTLQLKLVDADALYFTWRWEHQLTQPRAWVIAFELVRPALAELADAVASPAAGETVPRALRRSLTGPLTDPARESALMSTLAGSLFPGPLGRELNVLLERGYPRPHIRLQPSPSTAQVPWEALRVDTDKRLVHHADFSLLPPATVRNAPRRRISPWAPTGPVVTALDPVVPGFGPGTELGPVLPRLVPGGALAELPNRLGDRLRGGSFHPAELNRDVVEELLADAARFLYVGHVSTADHGLGARLHLCCGADTTGRANLWGGHRPLAAADLLLGHRPDSSHPWRLPNRVAFIGCDSGDSRFAEPTGLVSAAIHCGASYVTASRWTLPTDAGIAWFTGAEATAFEDAVVAVDAAHDAPDPVAALNDWQRRQADAWQSSGDPSHSPVVWAALSTSHG